jgi:hypothetical protein
LFNIKLTFQVTMNTCVNTCTIQNEFKKAAVKKWMRIFINRGWMKNTKKILPKCMRSLLLKIEQLLVKKKFQMRLSLEELASCFPLCIVNWLSCKKLILQMISKEKHVLIRTFSRWVLRAFATLMEFSRTIRRSEYDDEKIVSEI